MDTLTLIWLGYVKREIEQIKVLSCFGPDRQDKFLLKKND